jgi:tRNA G18 (ribose-2'-O)-methylase SpoU
MRHDTVGFAIFAIKPKHMRKLSVTELNRPTIATFRQQPKTPIVVVLDNVRSALNVGSAFRTADAFALEHLYLCGITAQPPNKEISKTALGATESVPWSYVPTAAEAVGQLQAQGYTAIAVEQAAGSIRLENYKLPDAAKLALVFGNEVSGVSDAVMDLVDTCIEIPQFGAKHSLNVSVCVGIVVWDLFKKIKFD